MNKVTAFVGQVPEKFGQKKKIPKISLIAVALVVGAVGTYAIINSFAATPPKTLYLATNGSDSASCTQAAPCASFNRAYQVAELGDTVEVAAGTYASQSINEQSAKELDGDQPDVTFKPASGANVTVGSISSHASHITIQDMKISTDVNFGNYDPIHAGLKLTDITLKNLDGRNFNLYSATNVNMIGGDWGPASDCGGPYGGSNNSIRRAYDGRANGTNPNNIVIDGVTIHDIQTYDKGPCHMEGLAIFAGTNITVKNSKFYSNSIYDIFLQPNSGPISGITFENNWFAMTTDQAYSGSGASTVAFSGSTNDYANTTIRHNSFNGNVSFDDNGVNPGYSNFKVIGNIGTAPYGLCSLKIAQVAGAFSYNAWTNAACNSTERNLGGATPFVNPSNDANMDYHLKPGSAAIDMVPTSASGVTIDFDCGARPIGAANDAGADEYTSTGVCIGSSTTPPPPPPSDTTAPTVSLTAPANTSTVSGSTTLSANASDDTGVTGVQFKLDGNNLGSEDTSSPYSTTWDTTGTSNGSHTLTAVARDAAGNTKTSSSVTVTVSNNVSSSGRRYVATNGSDSGNNCLSQSNPCLSFDRAYSQASLGDVVEVAAGTYGNQTINYVNQSPKNNPAASQPDVTFQPASGASVTVGDVKVYAFHVTIQNMNAQDTNIPYDGPVAVHDVTFKNMNARNFTIDSGVDINIIGGDYGPASSCGGSYGGGNNGIRKNNNTMPSNILISGVKLHDVQSYDLNNCHIECLIIGAGDGLTIRNSKFYNCSIFDIFLQPFNGAISNVLIENNWFAVPTDQNGSPNSGRAVEFSTRSPWTANWNNVTVRNNSFNTALHVDDDTSSSYSTYTNFKVIGNILDKSSNSGNSCNSGVQYAYNIWKNSGCGSSSDGTAGGTFPYVNTSNNAGLDYHLKPGGNAAVDFVPANQAPNDDIDGNARPQGAGAEAGAHEVTGTTPTDTTDPIVSFSSPTNGSTVSGIVTSTAAASDNTGVAKVELSLDGSLKMTDTASPYNYSFDSKTLSNGSHTLTAKAYDAAGNSASATIMINVNNPDTTPPNAPTNVSATAANPTTVNLSWSAATDTGSNPTGVVKYNVLRNGVVIAQPTTTNYVDSSRTANTTYTYTIQAVDGAGNVSGNSNPATVTTPTAPDTIAPSVPTNLQATVANRNQVNLSWNASTDTGGSGIAGYNIYRGSTKLNSSLVTTTSYGDTTVSPNTTYSYRVEAVDGAGNKSAQTAAVSVTTPKEIRGDVTGPNGAPDGKIDLTDISYVIRNYNSNNSNSDISGPQGVPDGKVDLFDLSYIIRNYGQ